MNIKHLNLILLTFLFGSLAEANCIKKIKLTYLSNVNVYLCEDGTISHSQPINTNYEGLCGPTAAANAFHAYCEGYFVDPKLISKKYFSDLTPGARPDVMESGLNLMFQNNSECMNGEWKYYYVKNRWDYLNSLYYEVRRGNGIVKRTTSPTGGKAIRSPVLALIKLSTGNLHWVTVVDIVGYKPGRVNSDYEKSECKIVYNEMGSQTEASCSRFVSQANSVEDAWYVDIFLPAYVHLVFEPYKPLFSKAGMQALRSVVTHK